MNEHEIAAVQSACRLLDGAGLSFVIIAQKDFGKTGTATFTSHCARNKRARTDLRGAMREVSPKITIKLKGTK